MKSKMVLMLFLLAVVGRSVQAQAPATSQEEYIKTHYAKFEYRIPMRDGTKLFVAVYTPQAGAFKDAGPYPFLMTRTPYSCGPYGEDKMPSRLGPSMELLESGYIFVCGDARGRFESEGVFQEMNPHIDDKKSNKDVDESTDMYDTVEFLLKHVENNNGKVGITGISYPGFYTSASIIDSHPAIKAASPQAPMTNLFFNDDAYHGGAFMLSANYGFYIFFKPQKNPTLPEKRESYELGVPDSYKFYLKAGPTENLDKGFDGSNFLFHDQLVHTTYDEYWKKRDLSPHMKNIHAAVMTVGGWFDAEDLSGPFKTFHAIDEFNPGAVNTLVVGPWTHGGWSRNDGDHLGDVTFNTKTSLFYRTQIEFPFFEHYLKGHDGGALPKAYVFETGSNVWKKYDAWPPKSAAVKTLYFREGGKLSFDAPTEKTGVDEYVSDPAHPVPFVNYTTDTVPQRYMDDDQRFASQRPDVLTYETEPLTEDVTIAGPVRPKLKVASSGTDADFVVKLIDVYPNDYPDASSDAVGKRVVSAPPVLMGGYEQLVRGEPMRAKFRDSWEKPTPLTPGKMIEMNAEMPDINHTFRAGHRIMVQVQSSWFPLVDRNPQTFVDIPNAKPEQFVKATESVYRSAGAASGVEVLVVPQH
ncbi:CocE/NonD family hydrolase [Tunturiibacter lichenicola]|uniref:CocE/NonD family hydrolase n=1 Tax=Tunturiibacter lichenicola TaxID=2051959 RepID=UPI003D9BBF4F